MDFGGGEVCEAASQPNRCIVRIFEQFKKILQTFLRSQLDRRIARSYRILENIKVTVKLLILLKHYESKIWLIVLTEKVIDKQIAQ